MAATLSPIAIDDGGGNAINGGVYGLDLAGDGSGPWATTHVQLSSNGNAVAAFGEGAKGNAVQRVTIATDDSLVANMALAVTSLATLDNSVSSNNLQVNLTNAIPAGTNNIGDVDVLSLIPGTSATNLGKAMNNASTATDTAVAVAAIRDDALSNIAPAEGAYAHLRVNVNGALWVAPVSGAADVVDDAAFTPGTTGVVMVGFEADETSIDSVDEGDGGAARMTLDRKVIVTPQPHTAGGLSVFRSLDLDETEEDIKSSGGKLYGIWFTNTNNSTRFLKLYNGNAATITVGTNNAVITIGLPGNSSDDISGYLGTEGMGLEAFSAGICAAATTGAADNDTGAPAAGDVIINAFYK